MIQKISKKNWRFTFAYKDLEISSAFNHWKNVIKGIYSVLHYRKDKPFGDKIVFKTHKNFVTFKDIALNENTES